MLLLAAKGRQGQQFEAIVGRVRLMKLAFLFHQELKKTINNEAKMRPDGFVPHHYGPYSHEVYDAIFFLNRMGFVEETLSEWTDPFDIDVEAYDKWYSDTLSLEENIQVTRVLERRVYTYELTQKGRRFCETRLWPRMTEKQRDALDDFKAHYQAMTTKALLFYVYTKYPKYTTASRILEEIVGAK